jgi:hypothetical protein
VRRIRNAFLVVLAILGLALAVVAVGSPEADARVGVVAVVAVVFVAAGAALGTLSDKRRSLLH